MICEHKQILLSTFTCVECGVKMTSDKHGRPVPVGHPDAMPEKKKRAPKLLSAKLQAILDKQGNS